MSSPTRSAPPWSSPRRAPASPTAAAFTDDTFANVRKHYDDDQIAALIGAIAIINAWNRLNAIAHTPAGDYVPGQWS